MKRLSSVCVISSLTGFLFFLIVSLSSLDSTLIELLEPVVGIIIIVTSVVGLVCLFLLKASKLITFKWWHFMWCVIVMCYLFSFIDGFYMVVVR